MIQSFAAFGIGVASYVWLLWAGKATVLAFDAEAFTVDDSTDDLCRLLQQFESYSISHRSYG